MKKKYSTLLNFALAVSMATALVACGDDGDDSRTGSTGANFTGPTIDIGGVVQDTNGNPLWDVDGDGKSDVTVSAQGVQTTTNSSGQYVLKDLKVTNVTGTDDPDGTGHDWVSVVINAPAGYLGATVTVYPSAVIDGTCCGDQSGGNGDDADGGDATGGDSGGNTGGDGGAGNWWDGGDGGSAGGNDGGAAQGGDAVGGDGGDGGTNSVVNPRVTFIDGMYAEAGTAVLPKLDSMISGRLENCDTEESLSGIDIRLDLHDVNGVHQQQTQDNVNTSYSTATYVATTSDDGTFTVSGVPDDSDLYIYVPGYLTSSSSDNDSDGNLNCGSSNPCEVNTENEGLVAIGDICVDTISTGDSAQPCVSSLQGWTAHDGNDTVVGAHTADSTITYAILHDDLDGTQGIDIGFNETMDGAEVDENSIVIYDKGLDTADDADDGGYITDFTASLSGSTLTITTTDPIPEDHHVLIYMLRDDFRDTAGNFASAFDLPSGGACSDLYFVEDYMSGKGQTYLALGVKLFSQDSVNVGAVTGLDQVCLADGDDAGLAALNAAYPSVFTDQGDSGTTGLFQNLNADDDYEHRLEALADVVGGTDSGLADVDNNHATVTFTEAGAGTYVVEANGSTYCTGDNNGESASCTVDSVEVGDTVMVTTYDDFDNPNDVAEIILKDCVAPTTVLNYAYNTCGHLGYDNGSWDINGGPGGAGPGFNTDNYEGICVVNQSAGVGEIGDGGENSQEGIAGSLGTPTLNITCRLLKNPADMPNVCAPVNFFGLYDNVDIDQSNYYDPTQGCNLDGSSATQQEMRLYDATAYAAWRAGGFADTIGVAFSEDIAITDAGSITWPGASMVTSWTIGNNIGLTDDGDPTDGGQDPVSDTMDADLVQITVDDVLTLANVDHGEVMDFSAAVEDAEGNAAENAQVIVNDLLPPFVEYAYWDGGLTIQFNEDINPDLNTDTVQVCNPITFACSAAISLANATVTGSLLEVPIADVDNAAVDDAFFPTFDSNDTNTVGALSYDEPIYDGLGFSGPYDHAILITDEIPDAHGNAMQSNDGGNTWEQWNNGFYDIDSDTQCNTPEFAVADVLGDFIIPTQDITNFDVADNICPVTQTHIISYTFSHPLDLDDSRWPGVTCAAAPGDCTVAEINNATNGINNAAWVDANVFVNAGVSMGAFAGLDGVGAQLDADRLGMTITFDNDCYDFALGNIVDPDWEVFSSFGVGSGLNLNAFVVAQ